MGPELRGAVDRTRALVGLEDDQELLDKLSSLRPQLLLIEMNVEVVVEDFKADEFAMLRASLLLLVKIHAENPGAPGVSLTPLLVLQVKELEAEDALAELAHYVAPKKDLDRGLVGRVEAEK